MKFCMKNKVCYEIQSMNENKIATFIFIHTSSVLEKSKSMKKSVYENKSVCYEIQNYIKKKTVC